MKALEINLNTKNKNDVIVKIVEKAMQDDSQALSFVSTRRFTESLATYVAKKINKKLSKSQKQNFKEVANKLLEVPKNKGSLPTTTCVKLADAAEKGIRLIDTAPRGGAEGLQIAFLHPKSTCSVLTELCEDPNK